MTFLDLGWKNRSRIQQEISYRDFTLLWLDGSSILGNPRFWTTWLYDVTAIDITSNLPHFGPCQEAEEDDSSLSGKQERSRGSKKKSDVPNEHQ